jgi:hypothetical protein
MSDEGESSRQQKNGKACAKNVSCEPSTSASLQTGRKGCAVAIRERRKSVDAKMPVIKANSVRAKNKIEN